ncbi:type II 3-dehydroquinate dehydratase [Piscinibacter sakaiensis]|uniref:type II 3-dehydroquinate dehydratase n=1 Tax=Piscinibacter sakaiensis TaxID=1547922 RepID=UPI003AAD86B1
MNSTTTQPAATKRRFVVIHGPNLNRLGTRDPARYGSTTLAQTDEQLDALARNLDIDVECMQSNHEGVLVDWLHERVDAIDGIVINPASLTPYGRSLAQAVAEAGVPVAVVHISAVYKLAKPGRTDLYAEAADVVVTGMGIEGYSVALSHLARRAALA